MEGLEVYKFRLYPTEEQEVFFVTSFGCVRKICNLMLNRQMKAYEKTENGSTKQMSFPTLVKYKEKFLFLTEVVSFTLDNTQLNLYKAYKNFFHNKYQ